MFIVIIIIIILPHRIMLTWADTHYGNWICTFKESEKHSKKQSCIRIKPMWGKALKQDLYWKEINDSILLLLNRFHTSLEKRQVRSL